MSRRRGDADDLEIKGASSAADPEVAPESDSGSG